MSETSGLVGFKICSNSEGFAICNRRYPPKEEKNRAMRFGKYARFRWGSPELEDRAERRIVSSSNRVVGPAFGKEST